MSCEIDTKINFDDEISHLMFGDLRGTFPLHAQEEIAIVPRSARPFQINQIGVKMYRLLLVATFVGSLANALPPDQSPDHMYFLSSDLISIEDE